MSHLNDEYLKSLKVIRLILLIFVLGGSIFAYDMTLTVMVSDRYHLFELNYFFLTIFFMFLICYHVITYKIVDYYTKKRINKFTLTLLTLVLIINLRFIYLSGNYVFDTYEEVIKDDYRYGAMYQNIGLAVSYVSFIIEYFLIELFIKKLLIFIKIKRYSI